MARRVIEPTDLADTTQHHFSPAIVADGTLYVSGQVGTDVHGNYPGDDVESQTRQAFENVEVIELRAHTPVFRRGSSGQ